jgi:hypothetical protein
MDMAKVASGLISVKGKASPVIVNETPQKEKKRKALLVKLHEPQSQRLKEASYKTDKNKQQIMSEALDEWLEKRGF